MHLNDALHDEQSEAHARHGSLRQPEPPEWLKHGVELRLGDANAVIGDAEYYVVCTRLTLDGCLAPPLGARAGHRTPLVVAPSPRDRGVFLLSWCRAASSGGA